MSKNKELIMSNQYVLIESHQPAESESIPSLIVHKIADDTVIQPMTLSVILS